MKSDEDPATAVLAELTALMQEFFQCVSFLEGGRPTYQRLHDLFIDGGRLIKNSSESPEISTVDQFITPRNLQVEQGELTFFEEVELAAVTEMFGNVAHRFSTYVKRGEMGGVAFEGRGMISTQFIRTSSGWRMSSMAWDDERAGLVVPDRYNTIHVSNPTTVRN